MTMTPDKAKELGEEYFAALIHGKLRTGGNPEGPTTPIWDGDRSLNTTPSRLFVSPPHQVPPDETTWITVDFVVEEDGVTTIYGQFVFNADTSSLDSMSGVFRGNQFKLQGIARVQIDN